MVKSNYHYLEIMDTGSFPYMSYGEGGNPGPGSPSSLPPLIERNLGQRRRKTLFSSDMVLNLLTSLKDTMGAGQTFQLTTHLIERREGSSRFVTSYLTGYPNWPESSSYPCMCAIISSSTTVVTCRGWSPRSLVSREGVPPHWTNLQMIHKSLVRKATF